MTEKLSARLSYALVLSIIVLITGFVAVGVRAFASALISDSIYLGAFGVLLLIFSVYLILRRPPAATEMERKIRKLLLARSGQIPSCAASERHDRRRPMTEGRARTAVTHERRSKQLAGFRVVSREPVGAETARD
jgi:uncharacterized membrane protein YfcA